MSESLMGAILFYALATLTIVSAMWVAFSKNIVHSAFALLGTLGGVAGLYAFLSAELLVVLQIMIYIGGVLVLILFSVMLTSRISDVSFSNPSIKYVPGLLLLLLIAGISVFVAIELFGRAAPNQTPATVADIGNALLGRYLLPFYVASVVLFAVLIGAVGIARGYKHIVIEQLPPTNEHPDSPKADQREEERS